jgi:3'-phosphoadenosine 5'-phosphosulfate sulfotransferase (PAPS reductase)/FAD synthetase
MNEELFPIEPVTPAEDAEPKSINYARLLQKQTLLQRQCLSLDDKVRMSLSRIRDWFEHWDGEVYVAYSGGKDSDTLLDLVWSIYPDVPAVFSNTGLEYPEIVQHVKEVKARYPGRNVEIIRPKRTFRDVVIKDGFPVVSKKVARQLRILKTKKDDPAWANTFRLYDTGYKQDGTYSKASKLPDKWRHLLDENWNATELCCDALKKEPLDTYSKETGRKRMMGIMSAEGGLREKREHCNIFDTRDPSSAPILFWTEADVWEYLRSRGIPYSTIYDMGEKRTGCMFCGFGAHLEEGPNRFQRMASTHPKQWRYCINDLGMGPALKAVGIDYGGPKEIEGQGKLALESAPSPKAQEGQE